MGRPSKLTPVQWEEIRTKLMRGERASHLAKQYGVGVARISERFSKSTEKLKAIANQVVDANAAVSKLTVPEKVAVSKHVELLEQMQRHLLHAGNYGAATAHKLNMHADQKMEAYDPTLPVTHPTNAQIANDVMVLGRLANESSVIARSMLNPKNRETKDEPQVIQIIGGFD